MKLSRKAFLQSAGAAIVGVIMPTSLRRPKKGSEFDGPPLLHTELNELIRNTPADIAEQVQHVTRHSDFDVVPFRVGVVFWAWIAKADPAVDKCPHFRRWAVRAARRLMV